MATLSRNGPPVHLQDAPPVEGLPARQDGAQGHHARVPARRQDRRARLQRRGQVDASCGSWPGVDTEFRGDAHARARRDRRPARAGAAARREQGRARQRRGRRRRDARAARPLQRAGGQLLRRDGRRVRRAAGADRRRRRLEPRHATSSTRWTRCACRRPTPTSPSSPAASAAASRCAGCCSARPTCCCSTSRPTTSTPSRSRGSSATSPSTRAPSSPSPTIATSSTTSPAGSSSSTAARGIPYEGNYSSWLEQKQKRLAQEEKHEKARQRTIAAELEWVRQNPKGRQTKQKARLQNYEALVAQERNVKLDEVQIHIPTGDAPGRRRRRGRGPAQGLRRQAC